MSGKYSLGRNISDSFHCLLRCLGLPCIFIRSRLFTARLFATTIVAILLCGVVSSQNYSIRVTYNTNLRASFSLESAIIETAPAGTTLQVVGSHSRWLRINRNGNDVWMADWVAYTRVEEQRPVSRADRRATSTIAASLIGSAVAIKNGLMAIGLFRTCNAPCLLNLRYRQHRRPRAPPCLKLIIAVRWIGSARLTKTG